MKILIVEDDNDIAEILANELSVWGYDTVCVKDFNNVLDEFKSEKPELVLMDIILPYFNGFYWCQKIREISKVPLMFISSKSEDIDIVQAMQFGGDDYIVKPFSPSEVMARLRAVLRRMVAPESSANVTNENFIKIDNLEINLDEYSLSIGGEKIALTKKEIETMWTLAENPNKVFTRDNLLDSLWGFDYFGDSRTVDSHIKRLRAKLDTVEHPNWCIKTIWGVGYKFDIDA